MRRSSSGSRALGILAALAFCATTAHAQPGNTPPAGSPPPPPTYGPAPVYAPPPPVTGTHTVRYGTTIAGVDALAGGLFLLGTIVLLGEAFDESGDDDNAYLGVGMMIGGMGVYAFGPAYVHSKKGNQSGAWKSVGLRFGLPLLGLTLGQAMSTQECDEYGCYDDGDDAAGSLFGLGILTAMVIDWAVLAKVDRPNAAYYPYASATSGGGGVAGLAGSF